MQNQKSENSLKLLKRRQFLISSGLVCACSAVTTSCSLFEDDEEQQVIDEQDVELLNLMLEDEYKIVAAYDVAIDMGLLNQSAVNLAEDFRKDHIAHSEILVATIRGLRGRPKRAKKLHEYAFPKKKLLMARDILEFLKKFEKDMAKKYLQNVPEANLNEVRETMANIMGVESMHWAQLRYWLGESPTPGPMIIS